MLLYYVQAKKKTEIKEKKEGKNKRFKVFTNYTMKLLNKLTVVKIQVVMYLFDQFL